MKKRQLSRQPGIGDFKNKCSERVKRYDSNIIKEIYENIYENVYWNGSGTVFSHKEMMHQIYDNLKKKKISVLFLDRIVLEILTYFEKFQTLYDLGKMRQN